MTKPSRPRASVVVLASGTGGTGQSTLCAGLGAALAAAEHQVLLLDLHPSPSLWRTSRARGAKDGSLGTTATPHPGLSVLHAPDSPGS